MENDRTKPPRRAPGASTRGRSRGQSGGGRGGRGNAGLVDPPDTSAEPTRATKGKIEKPPPRPNRKGANSAATGSARGPAAGAPAGRPARTSALSMRKVLIRNIPHDWDQERVVEMMSDSGATRAHVWRFVPGGVRSNNRGMRCARMYLDFKKDTELAKSVIEKLDGFALTENELEGPTLDVAFAPFQKITREKQRKDAKVGTLDRDPDFTAFLESLAKPKEKLPSADVVADAKDTDSTEKPLSALVLYLNTRKRDKKGGKFGAKGVEKTRASRVKTGKESKPAKEKGKGTTKIKTRGSESGPGKDAVKPRKTRSKVPKEPGVADTAEPGAVRILSSKAREAGALSVQDSSAPAANAKATKAIHNSKGLRRGGKDGDALPPSESVQDAKAGTGDRRQSKSQKSTGRRTDQPKKIFAPKVIQPSP